MLPVTLTYYGLGKNYTDVAKTVPGPSTDYFGALARKHDLYIVAGLSERQEHLAYNVAVLIAPDEEIDGNCRKVRLPRGEAGTEIALGSEYPLFDTRFGRVCLMICYDGLFPEPARELTKRGAELTTFPVWCCKPLPARARALENHAYLASSNYTDPTPAG